MALTNAATVSALVAIIGELERCAPTAGLDKAAPKPVVAHRNGSIDCVLERRGGDDDLRRASRTRGVGLLCST
jgi:hypothetical protein